MLMTRLEMGYAEHCFQDVRPCGDGMISRGDGSIIRMMLADGIGHGQTAHNSVRMLQQQFSWFYERSQSSGSLSQCVREMHERMKQGACNGQAAVAVVELDTATGLLNALSIGNVKTHLIGMGSGTGTATVLTMPCLNGMVGGTLPSHLPLSVEQLETWSLLISHSDGISARALRPYLESFGESRTIHTGEAQSMANQIVERFGKRSDDASCAVVLLKPEGSR